MKKTILFQGDSITDCDRDRSSFYDLGCGYARIAAHEFKDDKNLIFLNRGVGGDRVCHLRARWKEDCTDLAPDIVSIAVGVNEVLVKLYEGFYTPHDEYERDYRYILDEVRRTCPKAKIIMVQPFIQIVSEQMSELSGHLIPITGITDKLAAEYADCYIRLGEIFDSCNKSGCTPYSIAHDGIHPTNFGHFLYSKEISGAIKKCVFALFANRHVETV